MQVTTYGSGVSKMPAFATVLERGDENHDGKLTRDEAPAGPAKQHFLYIDANKDGLITREEWEAMARILDQSENALLAIPRQSTFARSEKALSRHAELGLSRHKKAREEIFAG